MPKFYTVDRKETLHQGIEIMLQKSNDIKPDYLQKHVDMMFPDGVTLHGEQYFLRNTTKGIISPAIELLLEYVRRAFFSSRPSRFQSFFGFESIDYAEKFRAQYANQDTPTWEVEAELYFRADMSLLTLANSLLISSYFTYQYWSGDSSHSNKPFWEILLVPSVKVLRKIDR
jgi:hypothetical protein